MDENRVDAEWLALNAFREVVKIATKGDISRSTYDNSLGLGGEMYPDLLGPDVSLLHRARESNTTKEYRQRARLKSQRTGKTVTPLELLNLEIEEIEDLLSAAKESKDKGQVDQLRRKLKTFRAASNELNPNPQSENQLIFRDAEAVSYVLPKFDSDGPHRDFAIEDGNVLRLRVLHPDKPEHVTGADVIYERHDMTQKKASLVVIQYKVWAEKKLSLTEPRMRTQLKKLSDFVCKNRLCESESSTNFRFPFCAAFLRPTDKLQNLDKKFRSSGEHIPICEIDSCKSVGDRGGEYLELEEMREKSVSGEAFEYLFTLDKLGSRKMTHEELVKLYAEYQVDSTNHVIVHAQELVDA